MVNQDKDTYKKEKADVREDFDYTYVNNPARIAVYDDLLSAPHVITIEAGPTTEFIENLASGIHEQVRLMGGKIPYNAIREVSENFIHARFSEIVVSILDDGNTVRFTDQGPGIQQKDKAQLPGYTSAIEPMKRYIRGVGSGLPSVKEYLNLTHGNLSIEDNLGAGSVVTLSLQQKPSVPQQPTTFNKPTVAPISLTEREKTVLQLLQTQGMLCNKDIADQAGLPASSTSVMLRKMEEAKLIERAGKLRMLSDYGFSVIQNL